MRYSVESTGDIDMFNPKDTIASNIRALATIVRAKEYAATQDKWLYCSNLIEAELDIRATDARIELLETHFDAVNAQSDNEYIMEIAEYDDFSAIFARQADYARAGGRILDAKGYQASSAYYKAMAMERRLAFNDTRSGWINF
jgi:hypothetical protein